MTPVRLALAILALMPCALGAQESAKASHDGVELFEKKIRPVLVDRCYRCHSQSAGKAKAGLYLDTQAGLLQGGESGPVIVPGDPEKSLLVHAIRREDEDRGMPPKQSDWLSSEQIHDFVEWIRRGAPDPRQEAAEVQVPRTSIDFASGRRFWSYLPLSNSPPPSIREAGWALNDIDRFLLSKLEERGLSHVGEADRRTLIRRATFDLIGLPPTPEEVQAFLEDPSPGAFSTVVDRLLASPHYGERWGRHWLDIVRYADTAGCNSDYPIPQMYKYRNYVIHAFNSDKPYDEFIREQIAGDLLPSSSEAERREHLIATGYLAGTRRFASSEEGTRHLIIDDTIDNLGKAILGLTIGCARCHDHKFDAISSQDYYALFGIFASTRYPFPGIESNKVPRDLVPLIPAEEVENILGPFRSQLGELDAAVRKLDDERIATEQIIRDGGVSHPPAALGARAGLQGVEAPGGRSVDPLPISDPELRRKFEKLSAAEEQARKTRAFIDSEIKKLEAEKATLLKSAEASEAPRALAAARQRRDELKLEIKAAQRRREEFAKKMPVIDSAYAVWEASKRGNARMLLKGEPRNLGPEVPRRFLEVLGGQPLPPQEQGSGRLELAEWLTRPSNPLTPRVIVNRVWQNHFGKGIVQTPNDFGVRGRAPTHPELLEYLARRFVEGGWSIKRLHRLILGSRAYRMSSEDRAEDSRIDPGNDWLWRFSRRRLEGEEIRDAMLSVSGALDPSMGGEHPFPPQSSWNFTQHRPFIAVYETDRRSVYVMTQRIRRHPFFALFDGPDTNSSTAERAASTTPLQALFLMNDPFVHSQASKLASRLLGERADDVARLSRAWELAFGREPSANERAEARSFLEHIRTALAREGMAEHDLSLKTWESYARVVFRTNEFIYLD